MCGPAETDRYPVGAARRPAVANAPTCTLESTSSQQHQTLPQHCSTACVGYNIMSCLHAVTVVAHFDTVDFDERELF